MNAPRSNDIVRIRPFENSDAENFAIAARESVETVGKWMDWCHAGYSVAEAKTWIETCGQNSAAGTAYEFALVDPISDEFFGGAGVNQINTGHNFGNIGYWVRRSRRGRGIATAAARLLIEFAFADLKLTRAEFVIRPDNLPSRRVAEKVGAEFEVIARNRIVSYAEPWAGAIYSIVPDR
jgi:ribosomal-protein-serine acetyltransferase